MKFMPEARFYINPCHWEPRSHANRREENLDREQDVSGGGSSSKPKDVPDSDAQTKESQIEERLGMSIIALMIMVRGG